MSATSPAAARRTDFRLADVDPDSTPGIRRRQERRPRRRSRPNRAELDDLQEQLFAESKFGANRAACCSCCRRWTPRARAASCGTSSAASTRRACTSTRSRRRPTRRRRTTSSGACARSCRVPGLDRRLRPLALRGRAHPPGARILPTPETIESATASSTTSRRSWSASGTTIIKVMLHISRDEQKARLQERLDRPDKHWKYNPGDVDERAALGRVPGGVPDRARRARRPRMPRGTSFRPTTSGTRGWAVQQLLLEALRSSTRSGRPPTSTSRPRRSASPRRSGR